jgi:hypothetical protein
MNQSCHWGILGGLALIVGLNLGEADQIGPSSESQTSASRLNAKGRLQLEAPQSVAGDWLGRIQLGLSPAERNILKWDLSINGRTVDSRTRYVFDIDCKYRNGSQALKMLQYLACAAKCNTVIQINQPRQTFESRIGVAVESGTALIRFEDKFGVKNYVGDGVPGQFLTPRNSRPYPDDIYSVSDDAEIHIQSDLPLAEAVATAYHEIYHAFAWSAGRLWRHGETGVNKAIKRIELKARENAIK